MKSIIGLLIVLVSTLATGQNKEEIAALANTRSLQKAVFDSKDSAILVELFSEKLSYGHSNGRVEDRDEAIRGIVGNKSTYADLVIEPIKVWVSGEIAITRHTMTANEKSADGKINPIKLHILMVWTKEKKDWKLVTRQAVRVN